MALASMHMGSGPGVAGLSGMQVNPFFPSRSVRIFPPASIATTVAPLATLAGAAFMALAMSSASLGFAAAFFAGGAPVAAMAVMTIRPVMMYVLRMCPPPLISQPSGSVAGLEVVITVSFNRRGGKRSARREGLKSQRLEGCKEKLRVA